MHFAALGLALFAIFLLRNGDQTTTQAIKVTTAQQEQLLAAYTRVWRRPPSDEEFKGLLDDWVREELANREAIAMGLASNDLVIRRRLRQKYESFMDQIAAAAEPEEAELEAWYETHAQDYLQDARYSLAQRFFSSDRRDNAKNDAQAALSGIDIQNPELDPEVGDSMAMAQTFANKRSTELGNQFGPAFAEQLKSLPQGRWAGPVPSAYGFHLVFIESAEPAIQQPLDEVRDVVLRDWRAQQLDAARTALYAGLLQRYELEIESSPAPSDS
ncbi:MAG: peptidylprolyl isomerase [Congregibacter sp.]|nr:peptidylprolyl isomerase [Congregibacter sp.]